MLGDHYGALEDLDKADFLESKALEDLDKANILNQIQIQMQMLKIDHIHTDALLGPGVNPLEGSPNVKLRKLGPKGTLPFSNSRKGQRVELGAKGLDQEEGLAQFS